jgi:hypothetical protein
MNMGSLLKVKSSITVMMMYVADDDALSLP